MSLISEGKTYGKDQLGMESSECSVWDQQPLLIFLQATDHIFKDFFLLRIACAASFWQAFKLSDICWGFLVIKGL